MAVSAESGWMPSGEVPEPIRAAIARFSDVARNDPGVTAAFIGGSYATGTADEHSDLDLYVIVDDARYNVPVMIIAGSADSFVPVEQSEQLFEASRGLKRLLIIEGADHNDFALAAGAQLVDEVVAFLDDVLFLGNG